MEGGKKARVSSIFIYPIKSCRGISVRQAPVTPTGFRWDRQWLIVNQKGRMYTQRVEPKLALIAVDLPDDAFSEDWHPTPNSYLGLRAPGMNELKVPLSRRGVVTDGISCWEWSGSALDEGQEAADWLSNYLGKPSRLVRFNTASENRAVDPQYARGHRVMFSDQYPYMILSQGSLDALNRLLKEPIPIDRFRPNILVDGCDPFSEDLWTDIRIGEFAFRGVKLCSRCKVPTINQETGLAGPEPNKTLQEIRSDKALRPTGKQQGKIYFGQNLVVKEDQWGTKKSMIMMVGDPISVVKMVGSAAEAAA